MLQPDKLALIDATKDLDIHSIVDLGGMWLVHGGYLDYATKLHNALGMQVDFDANSMIHGCHQGDFTHWLSNHQNLDDWVHFDMALLFDTLLHQICPMQVLKDLTARCDKAILIAQPCLTDPHPVSVNLQFGDQTSYDMDDRDTYVTEHGRPDRWTTSAWAWGQSTAWIIAAMTGFGWIAQSHIKRPMQSSVWCRDAILFVPPTKENCHD